MRRVLYPALLAVAIAVPSIVTAGAPQPTFNTNKQVTFVMRGGDRHTGTLVYHNTADFNLIENGSEKAYRASDIAMVDFGTGDPAAAELNKLPTGQPTELRSHMIVLRDGRAIHGKVYTIKANAITIDTQGGRRDVDLNNVSHLYMNPDAARQVFAAQLNAPPATATPAPALAATSGGAIQVDASRPWTDTGVNVRK